MKPFQLLNRRYAGSLALPAFEPNDFATGWLDRSADLLGATRVDLLRWLDAGDKALLQFDLDREPHRLMRALHQWAERPEEWGSPRPLLGPGRLAADKRVSFCPLCMAEDVRRRRLPYFRVQWTWAWLTHCPNHLVPLFRWDILRDAKTGERALPAAWVAQGLGKHCRDLSLADQESAKRIQGTLRVARAARSWIGDDSAFAWFWRQQVAFEQELHKLRSGRAVSDILGGFENRQSLLHAIDDLAVLLSTNFNRSEREPWSSSWKSYLGPDALFGGFSRASAFTGVPAMDAMTQLADPRARRTVIAMIVRILLAFRTDLFCSGPGAVAEPGFNALTSDLKGLPDSAKSWCAERWDRWPNVVRRGVEKSL